MSLFRAAATVSGLTFASRVLGLVREMLVARIFGAGPEIDAFFAAFRLPNMLRRLFAEGAFQQAFVPVLAEVKSGQGAEATRTMLTAVGSALFWALLLVSVIGVVAAPSLLWLIAGGIAQDPSQFDIAVLMTRWMFPYILFISLVAFAGGVLNSFGRFGVPAVTPVLLNVALILAALLAMHWFDPPVLALAVGVAVGGIAQLALQVPALLKLRMLPGLVSPWRAYQDPVVRRVLRKMVPALFAGSVAQLSLLINTNIASHLGPGNISWISFADRLMEFPTALLGVAFGTVLLPGLSRAYAESRLDDYSRLLDWGLRLTFLLALPAAVGLGLLAEAVIAVLYQSSQFSAYDVSQSAWALTGYAIGLVGLSAIKILAPGYYARQDVRTPVKIAVAVLIATQLGNLILVPLATKFALGHAALTLSISLGACLNAALLYWGLRRRGHYQLSSGWFSFFWRVAVALLVLAGCLWVVNTQVPWVHLHTRWLARAGLLAVVIAGSAGIYFGVLWLLGFRPNDFRWRASITKSES